LFGATATSPAPLQGFSPLQNVTVVVTKRRRPAAFLWREGGWRMMVVQRRTGSSSHKEAIMWTTKRAALLLIGVALYGCGSTDRAITAPPSPPTVASFEKSGDQQTVTGNADLFIGGCVETYSFSAIRHSDGRVTGEWQIKDICAPPSIDVGTFISHGDVTCFTILPDGKTARVGGVIEKTTWPGVEPGQEAAWTVRDNSQGSKEPPDDASPLWFGFGPGAAEFHCDVGIGFIQPLPNERNNIHVRP
jgi:hypothetical protein